MEPTKSTQTLAGKKILIVDDDPMVSQLLAKIASREGAELVTKVDGAEALEYLTHYSCDLAIVDLIMPKVDGMRLISVLRQMPKTQDLPIVVITSRRDRAAREDTERMGIALFLTKPIKWAQFSQQLVGVFEEHSAASSAVPRPTSRS